MKTWDDVGISIPFGARGNIKVRCPQCHHTHSPENRNKRDLSVNVDTMVWNCHRCGWQGGLSDSHFGDWTPGHIHHIRQKEHVDPRPLPEHMVPDLWQKALAWFEGRGIGKQTLLDAQITSASEYCSACDSEVGRILFPFFLNGKHVNTKHRCGKKHFSQEKDALRVLYNYDMARIAAQESGTLVIVEGEMDALSLMEAGMQYVVSVPDGAPMPETKNYQAKFDFLGPCEDLFKLTGPNGRPLRIVIATDSDDPGRTLGAELARRIGPERCSTVVWDEGIKDANECLVKAGPAYLRTCIETAQPLPVEGIYDGHNESLKQELIDLYWNGSDPGVSFGYMSLGKFYRVDVGLLSVVTGIPSHGKSTVMDQLFLKLAEREDWRFAIFSPEQQPLRLHQKTLIEMQVGKPFNDGAHQRMTFSEMLDGNDWVSDRFSFILPENPRLDTILALAKIEVFRRGVKGIVIDPWNEIDHLRDPGQTVTDYISVQLGKLKQFARNYGVHIWIIAHPTKMYRQAADDPEPKPGLYDISDSAAWRNKADFGICVWRDLSAPKEEQNIVEFLVLKVRFRDHGEPGGVRFRYDPASKRLTELGDIT